MHSFIHANTSQRSKMVCLAAFEIALYLYFLLVVVNVKLAFVSL
jgi:hypothetical protein